MISLCSVESWRSSRWGEGGGGGSCREIIKSGWMSLTFEKTPLISLSCKLVPVQYRKDESNLFHLVLWILICGQGDVYFDMCNKVVYYQLWPVLFRNHHSTALSILTLGSSRLTVTGTPGLLFTTLFWLPVFELVLCTHWEKFPASWVACRPVGPWDPCEPLNPWGPIIPRGPCLPLNPGGPAGPIGPWEPLKPGGPIGPWSFFALSTYKRDDYNM